MFNSSNLQIRKLQTELAHRSEYDKPETPDLGVHEVLVEGHEVLDERSLTRTYVNDKPVHVKEVLIRRELRHGACELVTDKLHVRGCSDPA